MRPTYTHKHAEAFKALVLRGMSLAEIEIATGFTIHSVARAIRVVFGKSVRELRDSHGLAFSPSEGAITVAPTAPLTRVRLPSSTRKKHRLRLKPKQCPFCKETFQPKGKHSKYCSRPCASKAAKPRRVSTRVYMTKMCANCGQAFSTFRPEQKYCDDECRKARISQDKTQLTEVPCPFCEMMFRPRQRSHKYCSRACAYKGKASGSFVRGVIKMPSGRDLRFVGTYELAFLLYARSHTEKYPELMNCEIALPYELDGVSHTYYPDFMFTRPDGVVVVVELKSAGTVEKDPEKHAAKVAAAQFWCAIKQHEYLLLDENTEEFRVICDFVRDRHNLDALTQRLKEDAKLEERLCKKCGRKIPRRAASIYRTRTFCSLSCSRTYVRSAEEIREASRHVCPTCGRCFVDPLQSRIYCSKKCYSAAQKTLTPIQCVVCGASFQPQQSKTLACSMKCGIVCRVASRLGLSVGEYLDEEARNNRLRELREAELPSETTCSRCGELFKPSLKNKSRCESCRGIGPHVRDAWTLESMLIRLKQIRTHLDGRVPRYSELYHSHELKNRFNSCSLAGAIFRFNQANGLASYADFCEKHLEWTAPRKLSQERLKWVLNELVRICGGIPTSIGSGGDVLGHRGATIASAVKAHFGFPLGEYCKRKRLRRVSWNDADMKLRAVSDTTGEQGALSADL
jgi:hypothetical protein